MKVCICTTPIRPVPTTYPPFGSLAIIQSLRAIGVDTTFFNIDYFRYSAADLRKHFEANQFDVVGVSAVVSTACAFTKSLTQLIREVSPRTTIIVGGNLAASAEILLRKCAVDFCVIGDGEIVIRNLIGVLQQDPRNYEALRATKGICFLDERGQFEFTGFGPKPAADEIEAPDYSILEQDGSLDYFVTEMKSAQQFRGSDRAVQPGERSATVVMTKGCVARCTFCHRFEKGFRAKPTDQVIDHIESLMARYHVRYVDVADENFGSDKEIAAELATELGRLGITWRCAGVRTRTVTKESLAHWKANGCVSVIYGIESGSPTMLEVMEKNTTVEQNIRALQWTHEVGLSTVTQLVLGMPGETDQTIYETIAFLKAVMPFQGFTDDSPPSAGISINYAQALPGTPLYEYGREHGFIGATVDEEEKYLLRISDVDAYSEDHFINYTGLPLLKVLMWRPLMLAEVDAHFAISRGAKGMSTWQVLRYYAALVGGRVQRRLGWTARPAAPRPATASSAASAGDAAYDYVKDSGFFNVQGGLKFAPLLLNPTTRRLFYPLLAVAVALWRGRSPWHAVQLCSAHLYWSATKAFRKPADVPTRSLRRTVAITARKDHDAIDKMIPLRQGR